MEKKSIQIERLVFFSDAVIAIAITLLALELKIEPLESGHLHFSDLLVEWRTFLAFTLSFLNIANFWKTHHSFFAYIHKMDERLLTNNILWLFFIILLPFSTTLVSDYFSDTAAICTYSINLFFISVFENNIWDYSYKKGYLNREKITEETASRFRLFCNLHMLNALLAIGLSFVHPVLAFILLFTKLPMILLVGLLHRNKFRAEREKMIRAKRLAKPERPEKKRQKRLDSSSGEFPVEPSEQNESESGNENEQEVRD